MPQQSQEQVELGNLEILIETYEEIAAMRMRKMRSSVLQNREFVGSLNDVFQQVKISYHQELKKIMQQKRIKDPSKLSVIKRNGKTLSVLLSANVGLYGDIVKRTFSLFLEDQQKNQTDVMIIGKRGKTMFEEAAQQSYLYFDYPDTDADPEELKKIVTAMIAYEKILIYYGQFVSVAKQAPTVLDVYGEEPVETEQEKGKVKTKYIFEPSLETIIKFFESEIFASVVDQTMYESQLAKYASRLLLLDSAMENIKGEMKKLVMKERLQQHRKVNSKQLNSLSGLALWAK